MVYYIPPLMIVYQAFVLPIVEMMILQIIYLL